MCCLRNADDALLCWSCAINLCSARETMFPCMQMNYHNLEFLQAALQTLSQHEANSRADVHLEHRLKHAIAGILHSTEELVQVLRGRSGEFAALDTFLVRVLAPALTSARDKLLQAAVGVEKLARGVLRRIDSGHFDVPDQSMEQLKRMLRVGSYKYLNVPLPAGVLERADDKEDDMGVCTWSRESATAHKKALHDKDVVAFVPSLPPAK